MAAYETRATTAASPSAQQSGQPEPPDPAAAAEALDAALASARQAVNDGCPQQELVAGLTEELGKITANGAIARAVLLRLTANLTGTVGSDPSVSAKPGDDLQKVLSLAAPGAIVYLAKGDYTLADTLVLLDSVTLAGEGRRDTTLHSSATEVAVLVMTGDLVGFRGLSLAREPGVPGSGIVTGGSATVFLEDVAVSGARPGEQRQGGAGIDLTGSDTASVAGKTTLEVTDSSFEDNGWAGISVSGGHEVSVESSSFDRNVECGICFLGNARGSVQRSRFTGNGVGLAAIGTSRPVVRGNTFSGGEVGVQVGGKAEPTVDGNRIRKADRAAVIYTDTAAGVLRKTVCAEVDVGIALAKSALPSLMDNDCTVVRAK